MLWTQMDSNKVLILKYYTTIKMEKKSLVNITKKPINMCLFIHENIRICKARRNEYLTCPVKQLHEIFRLDIKENLHIIFI